MSAARDRAVAPHPWDDAAEGWGRHADLIRDWLREATEAMLDGAGLAPGQRVLDVAAGAGDQTVDVARRVGPGGEVLATDASARILVLAQARFDAAGLVQVRTRQADAQALGLAGAGFDAAVCRLGLMLCPDPLQALREIRAALARGGRFSGLVFAGPDVNPCITTLMRTACEHAGVPAPDPFAAGSLLSLGRPGLLDSLLRQAGFDAIEVRPLSAPLRTAGGVEYVDFVRTSGAPVIERLGRLTAPARAAAWDDITRRLERFTTPGGWEGPNGLLLWSAVNP